MAGQEHGRWRSSTMILLGQQGLPNRTSSSSARSASASIADRPARPGRRAAAGQAGGRLRRYRSSRPPNSPSTSLIIGLILCGRSPRGEQRNEAATSSTPAPSPPPKSRPYPRRDRGHHRPAPRLPRLGRRIKLARHLRPAKAMAREIANPPLLDQVTTTLRGDRGSPATRSR